MLSTRQPKLPVPPNFLNFWLKVLSSRFRFPIPTGDNLCCVSSLQSHCLYPSLLYCISKHRGPKNLSCSSRQNCVKSVNSHVVLCTRHSRWLPGPDPGAAVGPRTPGTRPEWVESAPPGRWGRCSAWRAPGRGWCSFCGGHIAPLPLLPPAPGSGTLCSLGPQTRPRSSPLLVGRETQIETSARGVATNRVQSSPVPNFR